mmetsp:Transcript_69424/g.201475  ORF Transcript_69424/g.201475 Transcript_69424/m.201475 type:complete len:236 (+) Transcript_69424:915-1622(+)
MQDDLEVHGVGEVIVFRAREIDHGVSASATVCDGVGREGDWCAPGGRSDLHLHMHRYLGQVRGEPDAKVTVVLAARTHPLPQALDADQPSGRKRRLAGGLRGVEAWMSWTEGAPDIVASHVRQQADDFVKHVVLRTLRYSEQDVGGRLIGILPESARRLHSEQPCEERFQRDAVRRRAELQPRRRIGIAAAIPPCGPCAQRRRRSGCVLCSIDPNGMAVVHTPDLPPAAVEYVVP